MQPAGHHLAEFNFGTLAYDWDDPHIADFVDNIDKVNAVAARSPGFVWRLGDDAMEAEQEDPNGPLTDRPLTASTLSVWEGPEALWHFVEKTLHARFMARAAEWFEPGTAGILSPGGCRLGIVRRSLKACSVGNNCKWQARRM